MKTIDRALNWFADKIIDWNKWQMATGWKIGLAIKPYVRKYAPQVAYGLRQGIRFSVIGSILVFDCIVLLPRFSALKYYEVFVLTLLQSDIIIVYLTNFYEDFKNSDQGKKLRGENGDTNGNITSDPDGSVYHAKGD